MSIKIEVGRLVYYIRKDREEEKETNFYPPIGTIGIITEVCSDGCIVVNWKGNNKLNGGGYCGMADVEYSNFNFFSDYLRPVLIKSISADYVDDIMDNIGMVIMEDVLTCSGWADGKEEFNDYDIRLAIGRVLKYKLGIDS